ncbi:hypothetical protein Tco_0846057 [Tanacetum coccineum]
MTKLSTEWKSLDDAIAKGEIDLTKVLKKRRHDDKDKDPSADAEKGKKKRRRKDYEPSKDKDTAGSSKKGKAPSQTSKIDKSINADETIQEAAMETEEPVQDNVVNVEEQPKDDVAPKKDNSIWFKQDVFVRPETLDPEWHKEPNADDAPEQNWFNELANPEGDKRPYDMSKPLPLQGPPSHLTILVDFFFNNDLEYLKTGNKERKYAASLTKTKATRIKFDKQFGYGYLNEIVLRRANQEEYTFKEADFSRLHLNDIEDMYLLYVQHKLHNLTRDEIVNLVNVLRTFTQGIVIQRRVEDVQFGVETVVYMNKSNRKRLMRADELYKFYDGTLKSVCNNLHEMLHNFVLGYNHVMLKRAWTEKDQKRTNEIVKLIANLLLERQITRSLECFVGGRTIETDYRLLTRTV